MKSVFRFDPQQDAKYMQHCTQKAEKIVSDPKMQRAIEEIADRLWRDFAIERTEIDAILAKHKIF